MSAVQDAIVPLPADGIASQRKIQAATLQALIARAGDLLPAQGPITAFVFLNTLQALEDLPFEEGIKKGSRLFRCHPYLLEDQYRERMAEGRIRREDLVAVLTETLGGAAHDSICNLCTRIELRLAMLEYPLRVGPAEELRWFVAETDALMRIREETPEAVRQRLIDETRHWVMRDLRGGNETAAPQSSVVRDYRLHLVLSDLIHHFGQSNIEDWLPSTWESLTVQSLWRLCRTGVHAVDPGPAPPPLFARHRDILLEVSGQDSDSLVHEVLIRFCAAFADQGFAPWPLPHRDEGYFKAFFGLYSQPAGPPNRWMQGLPEELSRIEQSGMSPIESVLESLEMLGVEEPDWDEYVTSTLLALRGWAGLIWQMEVRADRVAVPAKPGSLVEFLAVRLILERLALAYIARESLNLNYHGHLSGLREAAHGELAHPDTSHVDQRAFLLFQLAQLLGWTPAELYHLSKRHWSALVAEVEAFSGLERRRLLHLAFERRLRIQALDAISLHAVRPADRVPKARFQCVFCIDAREESFRRHLEEIAPEVETFGAAGFYGVAMYYRGVADAHFATLCPIVIRPQHWVIEEVVYPLEEANRRRAATRRALGTATMQVHVGSRSIAQGALLTAGLGVLASVPLVARVLFPRLTATIRNVAGSFVAPPEITRLRLERLSDKPGPEGDNIGFSLAEMATMGERMLRDIGLTTQMSRLVFFFGHGSFCLNNPHKSAYDCGACSGSAGGPNARALAIMLNDPRVREILASRGLEIPRDTMFVGGLHNTCNDSITYYDLDLLPKTHLPDFEAARRTLQEVCARNAHERCRRFESAPLDLSFAEAHRHVEERAEDLAQTRPEFGNASNAMCYVGRRARIRGLYLDRRSFMHSYDTTTDDADFTILGRILGAVVPVCSGINLQYFFSSIDSGGWGCGTKLPHNVTALLGVMDGFSSDLRCGLPWQGVEIHEPVRLLFIIEAPPEAMYRIMDRNPLVARIIKNGWVQLSLLDAHSPSILVYRDGTFTPYERETQALPAAPSSTAWYRGWRKHLGFAQIQP